MQSLQEKKVEGRPSLFSAAWEMVLAKAPDCLERLRQMGLGPEMQETEGW